MPFAPVPAAPLRSFPLLAALAIPLAACEEPPAASSPADPDPPAVAEEAGETGDAGEPVELFDGATLDGWSGEEGLWSVEETDGGPAIVGTSTGLDHNTFLTTDRAFADFDLTFEMRLVPDDANSGVQFRSERIKEEGEETAGLDGEMRGYQADAGAGWWGKLYEESLRGMLYPAKDQPEQKSAEAAVKPGEWNVYRIRAEGDRVRTWLNGAPSVDLVDPDGRKEGLIGLQMHSGGPMTVKWRRFVMRTL